MAYPKYYPLPRKRKRKRLAVANFHSRSSQEIRIHFQVNQGLDSFKGRMWSLSDGGLFLVTDQVFEKGCEMTLRFCVNQRMIQCKGRVIYQNRLKKGALPAGLGVKFSQIDEKDLLAIKSMIEEYYMGTSFEGLIRQIL